MRHHCSPLLPRTTSSPMHLKERESRLCGCVRPSLAWYCFPVGTSRGGAPARSAVNVQGRVEKSRQTNLEKTRGLRPLSDEDAQGRCVKPACDRVFTRSGCGICGCNRDREACRKGERTVSDLHQRSFLVAARHRCPPVSIRRRLAPGSKRRCSCERPLHCAYMEEVSACASAAANRVGQRSGSTSIYLLAYFSRGVCPKKC